jgi:uncharacterized protein (DUF1697 family)
MTIYIALLRGINVGGKNRIKMANLKDMFESMGLSGVETYIQSGNIIFESNEREDTLGERIACEIERVFGFSVAVILRTAAQLESIIQNCPFSEKEITEAEWSNLEGESLYVSLLSQAPSQEKKEYWNSLKGEGEQCRMENRDIYLLFRSHGIGNSRLANNLQKLDVPVTVRNWKTINKLFALVKARTNS